MDYSILSWYKSESDSQNYSLNTSSLNSVEPKEEAHLARRLSQSYEDLNLSMKSRKSVKRHKDNPDNLKTKLISVFNNARHGWLTKNASEFKNNTSLWLMGRPYKWTSKDDDNYRKFLSAFSNLIWLTYRQSMPMFEDKSDEFYHSDTSDVGWGCMLRCGQMLLANALLRGTLGRGHTGKIPAKTKRRILTLFADTKNALSPFSIYELIESGGDYGKKAGNWYGPVSISILLRDTLKKIKKKDLHIGLEIYVAIDCRVSVIEVLTLCSAAIDKDSNIKGEGLTNAELSTRNSYQINGATKSNIEDLLIADHFKSEDIDSNSLLSTYEYDPFKDYYKNEQLKNGTGYVLSNYSVTLKNSSNIKMGGTCFNVTSTDCQIGNTKCIKDINNVNTDRKNDSNMFNNKHTNCSNAFKNLHEDNTKYHYFKSDKIKMTDDLTVDDFVLIHREPCETASNQNKRASLQSNSKNRAPTKPARETNVKIEKMPEWQPVFNRFGEWQRDCLIMVPLRLGLETINDQYVDCLRSVLCNARCVGMLGGRKRKSYYIVGFQDNYVIYLDPHNCQDAVNMLTDDYPLTSFTCTSPRKIKFQNLDPSLCIAFHCTSKQDFLYLILELTPVMDRTLNDGVRFLDFFDESNDYRESTHAESICEYNFPTHDFYSKKTPQSPADTLSWKPSSSFEEDVLNISNGTDLPHFHSDNLANLQPSSTYQTTNSNNSKSGFHSNGHSDVNDLDSTGRSDQEFVLLPL